MVAADRCRQLRPRAVGTEAVGDLVEELERLPETPSQLRSCAFEQPREVAAVVDDLAHEASEEDGVARLVDLLGREEVLLLLAWRCVYVGREVVGDSILAVEEERVVPQRGSSLEVGELVMPMLAVDREIDRRRLPVLLLPARVEILVGDLVGDDRCTLGHFLALLAFAVRSPWTAGAPNLL
ncbi:hypothetical protein HRbin41_01505 [bacterium HR41]|nr:hypothetical protein HRbin41_01505 [bacterium HR41]